MKVEINNSKLLLDAATGGSPNIRIPKQNQFEQLLNENIEKELNSIKHDGTLVVDILDIKHGKEVANAVVDARWYDNKGMAKSGLLDVINIDKTGKLADLLNGKMFMSKFTEMTETLLKRVK